MTVVICRICSAVGVIVRLPTVYVLAAGGVGVRSHRHAHAFVPPGPFKALRVLGHVRDRQHRAVEPLDGDARGVELRLDPFIEPEVPLEPVVRERAPGLPGPAGEVAQRRDLQVQRILGSGRVRQRDGRGVAAQVLSELEHRVDAATEDTRRRVAPGRCRGTDVGCDGRQHHREPQRGHGQHDRRPLHGEVAATPHGRRRRPTAQQHEPRHGGDDEQPESRGPAGHHGRHGEHPEQEQADPGCRPPQLEERVGDDDERSRTRRRAAARCRARPRPAPAPGR